eukprot:CCRYP_005170-RA/>CCRYP_005170-RA protein AED:0.14 eAED:0.14 QI:0/-1/0/1/-1/0/1/0/95
MEASSSSISKPYVIHTESSVSQPASRTPKPNAILERMHQVIMTMLCIAELDMANTVAPSDIADFLKDAAWAALLHIPHGTQSLSRCSNIWQGHAV